MHRYKINNTEELEAAEETVDAAERIARRLHEYKHPGNGATGRTKFRKSFGAEQKKAWDLARGIVDELTGVCPERTADAIADYVRDQPDPSSASRAEREHQTA